MSWWIWLSIAVGLLVIEGFTEELISVWFAVSALIVTILTAIFPDLHWGWQVFIFAALSAVVVAITRPLVKKFLKKRTDQATNLELIIDRIALVEEEIDNDLSLGVIKINGVAWSARSIDREKIPVGTFVVVKNIDGNKLIVEKRKEEN